MISAVKKCKTALAFGIFSGVLINPFLIYSKWFIVDSESLNSTIAFTLVTVFEPYLFYDDATSLLFTTVETFPMASKFGIIAFNKLVAWILDYFYII